MTSVFSTHLHCPRAELQPYISLRFLLRLGQRGKKACDCTPGVFVKHSLLPFFFFFRMLTRTVMPLSPFSAKQAYLHMTLHSAVDETELCRVLFRWNDVLSSRMWQRNMKIRKEQLSQIGYWYSWGLYIMCLPVLATTCTCYYANALYSTACAWAPDYLNAHIVLTCSTYSVLQSINHNPPPDPGAALRAVFFLFCVRSQKRQ